MDEIAVYIITSIEIVIGISIAILMNRRVQEAKSYGDTQESQFYNMFFDINLFTLFILILSLISPIILSQVQEPEGTSFLGVTDEYIIIDMIFQIVSSVMFAIMLVVLLYTWEKYFCQWDWKKIAALIGLGCLIPIVIVNIVYMSIILDLSKLEYLNFIIELDIQLPTLEDLTIAAGILTFCLIIPFVLHLVNLPAKSQEKYSDIRRRLLMFVEIFFVFSFILNGVSLSIAGSYRAETLTAITNIYDVVVVISDIGNIFGDIAIFGFLAISLIPYDDFPDEAVEQMPDVLDIPFENNPYYPYDINSMVDGGASKGGTSKVKMTLEKQSEMIKVLKSAKPIVNFDKPVMKREMRAEPDNTGDIPNRADAVFCYKCGRKLREQDEFCVYCGMHK